MVMPETGKSSRLPWRPRDTCQGTLQTLTGQLKRNATCAAGGRAGGAGLPKTFKPKQSPHEAQMPHSQHGVVGYNTCPARCWLLFCSGFASWFFLFCYSPTPPIWNSSVTLRHYLLKVCDLFLFVCLFNRGSQLKSYPKSQKTLDFWTLFEVGWEAFLHFEVAILGTRGGMLDLKVACP